MLLSFVKLSLLSMNLFNFFFHSLCHRRLKKGEHYEDVQKELLENEIRIRERREKYKHKENDHYKQQIRNHPYRRPPPEGYRRDRSDHRSRPYRR